MEITEQVAPGSFYQFTVMLGDSEKRLDHFLSAVFNRYTRSFFKRLLDDGKIFVNEKKVKAGYLLREGDCISVTFPTLPDPKDLKPFDDSFGVKIVAEEPDFLIVYKPAGLIVHKPNYYSEDFTLVDWLIASYKDIAQVGVEDRPGIVHRLDKDTSGLLIIPRTNEAHNIFSGMFHDRKIEKTYWAIVKGHPDREGTIDYQIGRDPVHKHKMKHFVQHPGAREALTHYKVLAYYKNYTLVEVRLITGRTHQIRVHFSALGHPVWGDSVYSKKALDIGRQALHAKKISFTYKGKTYEYDQPVPEDMQKLLDKPTV